MATYTPTYNLGKPDSTDQFSSFLTLFNDNMDKIDNIRGGGGGSGKILKNKTLTFSGLTATLSDSDFKANSDYAVFYYDEDAAEQAGITTESSEGVLTFTATTSPQTTIIVDVVIFSASSGGTTVVANPQDPPTEVLTTIQIGDTVYSLGGGGGRGFENFSVDEGNRPMIRETITIETV